VTRRHIHIRGVRTHALASATLLGSALLSVTQPAMAHTGTGLPGGIVAGFSHPFIGLDHLLAMVSVGLWGARLGSPLIYALPVIFPAVMVVGAILGMLGVPVPPVEIVVAMSVLVLGTCIALSLKPPVRVASLIVAIFAVFHGYAHGKELPSAADAIGYSSGFVLATGLLHLTGIGIGALGDRPGGQIATRSIGAVIASIGVWLLCAGGSFALDGPLLGLLAAVTCALVLLHATWIVRRGAAIAVMVVVSWLVAVAILVMTLQFLPVTPGYAPDHME